MPNQPRIVAIHDRMPQVDSDAVVLDGATLAGDVRVGPRSSIWYSATVHAEGQPISIGADSNIQDGALVRADAIVGRIGDRVSIGQAVILHGATVEDDCLIGAGAVLLHGAYVERGCLVAAGTLLGQDQRIPAGSLVVGSPAKVLRRVNPSEHDQIAETWRVYATLACSATTRPPTLPSTRPANPIAIRPRLAP